MWFLVILFNENLFVRNLIFIVAKKLTCYSENFRCKNEPGFGAYDCILSNRSNVYYYLDISPHDARGSLDTRQKTIRLRAQAL